jgi:Flp pilus assembly protein TadG
MNNPHGSITNEMKEFRMPPRLKGQRGAAIIEFALVLSFLLALLLGIIEFSIPWYNKAMITNASREGARAGTVFRPSVARLNADQIRNVVRNYAEAHLVNFDESRPPPTITLVNNDDNGDEVVPNSGDSLTVIVEYTYEFLVLPRFVKGLGATPQLTATTVMRYE